MRSTRMIGKEVMRDALAYWEGVFHRRDVKANRVRKPTKKKPGAWKKDRPQCGARCRSGEPCKARVCIRPDGSAGKRCRLHGGLSTGPKSPRPLAHDTPEKRQALLFAFGSGATVASACHYARMSPGAFYRICERDPAFGRATYEAQRERSN